MPVSFRILPGRNLVYVRYDGIAGVAETESSFRSYAAHPDFRPGQMQLIDVSRVTGYEKAYAEFIAMQARIAGMAYRPDRSIFIAFYATTAVGREMAGLAGASWDSVDGAVVVMGEDEGELLALLGLRERSFADLLASAD
ncbi:hypothetical protein [Wenxinia marina]|uniref:Uncharacterized protein n=1 Tax=Wenxinia marina DSM 24838 TaxID=1123501 RepID=A0A0D0QCC1_9RHOB|nr:hypothetical protein [Wenxinia marina]KIQ69972.1 hypothetical protein Wenmar_01542 [Wenxinia marina DSM 24838]GGL62536.1 hypothetical protein GCM10011392_16470 [Wenxinia marina]